MSVPGSRASLASLDAHLREEIVAHRAKVFDALSHHSDPTMRDMGRRLATGDLSPYEVLNRPEYVEALQRSLRPLTELDDQELRRRILGPPDEAPERGEPEQPEPASRRHNADPDNGTGGVPALRR